MVDYCSNIVELIREKSIARHQALHHTYEAMQSLKSVQKQLIDDLNKSIGHDAVLEYKDKGQYESEISIADDTLIFLLHSNAFSFESNHVIWKNSYVEEHPDKAFCGKIDIYNFLNDSVRFNRGNDLGYLIGRIFINNENHFFVEGKKNLGMNFTDFSTQKFSMEAAQNICCAAVEYAINFDLYVPPFNEVQTVTVQQIIESNAYSNMATGKRLGFRFNNDDELKT